MKSVHGTCSGMLSYSIREVHLARTLGCGRPGLCAARYRTQPPPESNESRREARGCRQQPWSSHGPACLVPDDRPPTCHSGSSHIRISTQVGLTESCPGLYAGALLLAPELRFDVDHPAGDPVQPGRQSESRCGPGNCRQKWCFGEHPGPADRRQDRHLLWSRPLY